MNSKLRLVIFLIFLFVFLISAPLVVLYTAGYRFDVSAGAVVHTGVLSIDSVPKGATVYLDGEAQTDRTPSLLDNILPGEHTIKLQKENYTTWEKTLPVESRNTTFVVDAVLFLDTEFAIEDSRTIGMSVLSPNKHEMAYLIEESSWVELWLSGTGDTKQLLTRLPNNPSATYTLLWSATGKYISLEQHIENQNTISIIDVSQSAAVNTHETLQNAEEYWWDAENDTYLYMKTDDNVYQLSVLDSAVATIIAGNPQTVISKKQTYVLSESSDRMVLAKQGNEAVSIVTYLPFGTYRFVPTPNSDLVMLEDTERGRVFLIELTDVEQPILLNKTMRYWEWDSSGDRLLYTDGFDIEIYSRSTHKTQTLTRLSEKITSLFWYPLGNMLIYATAQGVTAIELDGRDKHETTILYEGETQLVWTDGTGDYFFILTDNSERSGISSRQLQR